MPDSRHERKDAQDLEDGQHGKVVALAPTNLALTNYEGRQGSPFFILNAPEASANRMNALISSIGRHGYLLVFCVVLAESLGLPVPAAFALVAGGAAVASGVLNVTTLFVLAVAAMLLRDSLLFVLGRY